MCFLTVLSGIVSAQKDEKFKKSEFYVSYSNVFSNERNLDSEDLNGFEASAVYNFTRYFGVKGDFSAAFKSQRVSDTGYNGTGIFTRTFRRSSSVINALGGLQLKDNAEKGRIKPFAHALIGEAFTDSTVSDYQCTSIQPCSFYLIGSRDRSGFAAAVGGGLDVRIKNNVKVRAFQVDYNPIMFSSSGMQKNIRFGSGFVF